MPLRGTDCTHRVVHMHVAEPPLWYRNGLERGPRLLCDLCPLTGHTIPAPGNVRPHARPKEMCSNQPLRGKHTWMGHAVYGLKDELAIFLWNQGPQMASRDLKKKDRPLHLTGPEMEGGGFTGLEHARKGHLVG